LQLEILQLPVAQLAVAFAREQAVLHAPQWVSVSSLVSQPLPMLPSQLPKPAAHVIVQLPPLHPGVPFAPPQIKPQAPQLLGSVPVAVSQPFAGLPSQSMKPGAQVGVHTPAVHATWPFGFRHFFPQAPQWFRFVVTSSSQPLFGLLSQSA
jgi:hypothetical protein